MDSPVPADLAGADGSTNSTPPLVWQMASEDDLSMEEEVVADLDFCDYFMRVTFMRVMLPYTGPVWIRQSILLLVQSAQEAPGMRPGR